MIVLSSCTGQSAYQFGNWWPNIIWGNYKQYPRCICDACFDRWATRSDGHDTLSQQESINVNNSSGANRKGFDGRILKEVMVVGWIVIYIPFRRWSCPYLATVVWGYRSIMHETNYPGLWGWLVHIPLEWNGTPGTCWGIHRHQLLRGTAWQSRTSHNVVPLLRGQWLLPG